MLAVMGRLQVSNENRATARCSDRSSRRWRRPRAPRGVRAQLSYQGRRRFTALTPRGPKPQEPGISDRPTGRGTADAVTARVARVPAVISLGFNGSAKMSINHQSLIIPVAPLQLFYGQEPSALFPCFFCWLRLHPNPSDPHQLVSNQNQS